MSRPSVHRHVAVGGAVGVLTLALLGTAFVTTPWEVTPAAADSAIDVMPSSTPVEPAPSAMHLPTPEPLYAIYMSECVVGTPSFRDKLVSFIDDTDLNAVVIDIKDFSGTIAFQAADPALSEASLVSCGARDMKDFIHMLHEKNIYVIGRITVFQDPHYTKLHPDQAVQSISRPGEPWKDNKGLSFIDVSSRPFWDYIVTLSKESYALGFDELNYDYIRYPSDGPMADAAYVNPNKPVALEIFWKYLHDAVKPTGAVMSADLFGMTASNTDDLGIGQQLERALPYFDYIAPMVYPSHYPKGFLGLANPNSDPYKVVNYAMSAAVTRVKAQSTPIQTLDGEPIMLDHEVPAHDGVATTTTKVASGRYSKEQYSPFVLRAWLQDFDYGKDYTAADITAQIQAIKDAGLTSYMFWDPGNKYTSLREVLAQ